MLFPKGKGLYRLRDTNKDDQFDEIVQVTNHGRTGRTRAASLIPSPDEKYLYIVVGNSTAEAGRLRAVWFLPYGRKTTCSHR